MAYGNDLTVYVEDKAGDVGGPGSSPFWLSPDVDILGHTGEAVQGANQVQIRVHANDEPVIDAKITAEVYVGQPGLVLSPTTGTKRIDDGTLLFRPANIAGPEPLANVAGATASFSWTPSASAADVDGPGHRCLIVRAFPANVTPPSSPFTVPTEQHEAQHNIEVLTTTRRKGSMDAGGAGTPKDPRRFDEATGMWWEGLVTMATKKRGRRFVVWAFDPSPSKELVASVKPALSEAKYTGISKEPPSRVTVEAVDTDFEEIDPARLLRKAGFGKRAGLGEGLFAEDRLVAAAAVELGPRKPSRLVLRFDHSNLRKRSAVVLHGVQWSEDGEPEGGMTVVALAPIDA
jgi:hypothetical protein